MNIRRASLKNFKVIILIIGLLLTSERAYECVKKYLYFNTGTKITLVNSNETLIPVLIICPNPSYKTTILNQIGTKNNKDYRNGNWLGNSSSAGQTIFRSVTHDFADLVQQFSVRFKSGVMKDYFGSFDKFKQFYFNQRNYIMFLQEIDIS